MFYVHGWANIRKTAFDNMSSEQIFRAYLESGNNLSTVDSETDFLKDFINSQILNIFSSCLLILSLPQNR